MNICFICKYPPIQGGVSMHGYWAARGLAQRGHKIFVVTNANEVEPTFRILLTEADRALGGEYAKVYPQSSGFVKVHSTEPPDRKSLYYIPQNNPTVTRLAAIATDLIRAEGCEVIFTYYLEPYGLAAHLASLWTGIPYVLKHAGSDLHRLALLDDLRTTYVEVLHRANRIISSGISRARILSYGIAAERITSDVSFELPTDYFRPDAQPLNISVLLAELADSNLIEPQTSQSFELLDQSLPVLGIYGKLGEFKGTFDLLHAVARLVHSGFPFYLVAMSNGWQEQHFRHLIDRLKIAEYVRLLPFLPHWKVPQFIRSCTAVAFLERDFPITAHGPTIPAEVIACGKCLVVSEEIARKQRFRTNMRNFKNILIVPDPKKHDVLAKYIRFALEDPQRADEIGERALEELAINQNHQRFINGLESLLMQVATEEPMIKKETATEEAMKAPKTLIEIISRLFPCTYALLNEEQQARVDRALAQTDLETALDDSIQMPVALGRELLSALNLELNGTKAPVVEVCRYECELHEWERNKISQDVIVERELFFSVEELKELFPAIQGNIKVIEFSCDVEAMINAIKHGKALPQADNSIKILFHSSNGPMKINDSTEYLLGLLADGSKTTGEVFQMLCGHYLCEDERPQKQLMESCLSVLEALYWAGILEFRTMPFLRLSAATMRHASDSDSL